MDSIPLLCKICPEEPHFSDVSHLLTHISSKGHLYQCKNAQLRSHHDIAFRHQLDGYNEWYEVNRIEHLLAQRIAQKDSKNAKGKPKRLKGRSSMPVKDEESQQKSKRKFAQGDRPSTESTLQDPIDPQLSLFLDPVEGSHWTEHSSPGQRPPPPDIAPLHQIRNDGSRSWTPTSLLGDAGTGYTEVVVGSGLPFKSETDEESELDRPIPPSPIETFYPDPSTIGAHGTVASVSKAVVHPQIPKTSGSYRRSTTGQSPPLVEPNASHLLKLKGPQYPGMALFDSASPNSQRLRNQKKEHSLLSQMEHNAGAVEPMEHIYFPEWKLKKARVITGNVESSPIPENTPKPKRRRAKQGKGVLCELDTNIPVTKSLTQTMKSPCDHKSQIIDLEDPFGHHSSKLKSARDPKILPSGPAAIDDDVEEWRLNRGIPKFTSSPRFTVLRDDEQTQYHHPCLPFATQSAPALKASARDHRIPPALSNHGLESSALSTFKDVVAGQERSVRQGSSGCNPVIQKDPPIQRPSATASKAEAAKENIEPMLDAAGRIIHQSLPLRSEKITQRYFAVTGHHPPQFFNVLPPQMEFGGTTDHGFHASSLNPLNPQAWYQETRSYLPIFQQTIAPKEIQSAFDPFDDVARTEPGSRIRQISVLSEPDLKRARARK